MEIKNTNFDSARPDSKAAPLAQSRLFLFTLSALIFFVLFLPLIGAGNISIVKKGDDIVYRYSWFTFIAALFIAVTCCFLGICFWVRQGWKNKCFGITLVVFSAWILVDTPSFLTKKLIVSRDYFSYTTVHWFSPKETRIEFGSLSEMKTITTGKEGGMRLGYGQPKYELLCYIKPDKMTALPVNGFVKKALPEIYERASQHNIIVIERAYVP